MTIEETLMLGSNANKGWAADTSKFGFKMLSKMGWEAGKGLGKDLQGQAKNLVTKKRLDNLGLGCSLRQAELIGWQTTSKGFADVLAELNSSYANPAEKEDSREEKKKAKKKARKKDKKKKDKVEKKAKTVSKPKRILYHKRLSNKNASTYSKQDMQAILGLSASK